MRHTAGLIALALVCALSPVVHAYTVDIGFTALQTELGASTPTGANVPVAQVEAPINDVSGAAWPIFMPDSSSFAFIAKTISPVGGNPSGGYSDQATGVGSLFYETSSSMAPGITSIDSYEVTIGSIVSMLRHLVTWEDRAGGASALSLRSSTRRLPILRGSG